jgi:hypothetical protein
MVHELANRLVLTLDPKDDELMGDVRVCLIFWVLKLYYLQHEKVVCGHYLNMFICIQGRAYS